MSYSPGVAWVIVGGSARHVSEFAGVPPQHRPSATCPACGRAVTLKLGRVRRHHAAHAPGVACPTEHPETALHLECKLGLAAALRAASGAGARLRVTRRCAAVEVACDETDTSEWARGWTEVAVEHRLDDARRPDIVLLRDGAPIAAIEIVASHAVTPEKAAALDAAGVPWIELIADPALTVPGAWHSGDPLAVARIAGAAPWRCRRHSARLRAARVVDAYHPDGTRERLVYRIMELPDDGTGTTFRLQCGTREILTVSQRRAGEVEQDPPWPALRLAFRADVQRLVRHDGAGRAFTDSPMRWATGGVAESIVEEGPLDRRPRDPTPLSTTYPRRWFYASARGEWFLPDDMRDVRWDRPAHDAFAPHPAALAAHRVVRERPIARERWDQRATLFARRPHRAMFGTRLPSTARDGIAVVQPGEGDESSRRRPVAIVVIEAPPSAAAIAGIQRELDAAGQASIWLASPRDWVPAMSTLAWAPAGVDERGRGLVVVDGLGVFPAQAFARAVSRNDRRVSPAAIARAMAARVRRLMARERRTP